MGPDSIENAIPIDIIDIAINVEAKEIDRSEANNFSDIIGVATGIEVDACTTEVSDNSIISTDNTTNVPHHIHDTPILASKIQEKINQELEPGEQVLFTKVLVPRVGLSDGSVPLCGFFYIGVYIVLLIQLFQAIWFFEGTIYLLYHIQFLCFLSWIPIFIIPFMVNSYKFLFTRTFYVITDKRIITIHGRAIRSIDTKEFTDIIVQPSKVVYFQEWYTDPRGNQTLNELSLPLDQDETAIVAMLENLKERGNSTFDTSQPPSVINLQPMYPTVPTHVEEIMNYQLRNEERVVKTVMPKQSIFRYNPYPYYLGFGFYCLLVAIAVGLYPSIFILIPLILGLLVIFFTIRHFRNYLGTVYVITDCRAISISPSNRSCKTFHSVKAFPPFQPYHVFRRDYPNGTGDVIFASQWAFVDMQNGDGFFGIPNAKDVEKMLKEHARRERNAP
jgi:hypothetical protein